MSLKVSRSIARGASRARKPIRSAIRLKCRKALADSSMGLLYASPAPAPLRPGEREPEGGVGAFLPGVEGGSRRVEFGPRQEAAVDDRVAGAPHDLYGILDVGLEV